GDRRRRRALLSARRVRAGVELRRAGARVDPRGALEVVSRPTAVALVAPTGQGQGATSTRGHYDPRRRRDAGHGLSPPPTRRAGHGCRPGAGAAVVGLETTSSARPRSAAARAPGRRRRAARSTRPPARWRP